MVKGREIQKLHINHEVKDVMNTYSLVVMNLTLLDANHQ